MWGQGFCYLEAYILEEKRGKGVNKGDISESVKNVVLYSVNNESFGDGDCLCKSLQPQSRPQDDSCSNPSPAIWRPCDPGMPLGSCKPVVPSARGPHRRGPALRLVVPYA